MSGKLTLCTATHWHWPHKEPKPKTWMRTFLIKKEDWKSNVSLLLQSLCISIVLKRRCHMQGEEQVQVYPLFPCCNKVKSLRWELVSINQEKSIRGAACSVILPRSPRLSWGSASPLSSAWMSYHTLILGFVIKLSLTIETLRKCYNVFPHPHHLDSHLARAILPHPTTAEGKAWWHWVSIVGCICAASDKGTDAIMEALLFIVFWPSLPSESDPVNTMSMNLGLSFQHRNS